jgi:sigma-B regulation protein RsbU (phosphoserine phosphatase)
MVLGVFPDNMYDQSELPFGSRDRLVFYTDGITEARDPDGEEYGEDRLTARALEARTLDAGGLKDALLDDVTRFCDGKFEDDATLIVVGIP